MVNAINILCDEDVLLAADQSEIKLKNMFQQYYRTWEAGDVDLISSREIGFIPFFGSMIRHRAVLNLNSLSIFARKNVPRHMYYSSAYYRRPEEKVMLEKQWLGAELIFDLDADHLAGADRMTYSQILGEVKRHTERLVFKFLMDDLGFQEKDLKLFFSGGRGYHVHVVEDSVYPLSSDSRREIANYIRGEGFNPFDVKRSMQETSERLNGWKLLIDEEIMNFYRNLEQDTEKMEELHKVLGNSRTLGAYMNNLKKSTNMPEGLRKIDLFSKPGSLKYRHMDQNDDKVLLYVLQRVKTENQCEIDEPVTTDTHRLIRMPNSLHGKTGLKVKSININDFRSFDPLQETTVRQFSAMEVSVSVLKNYSIKLGGNSYNLEAGEAKIPGDIAVFLVAGKIAKFI